MNYPEKNLAAQPEQPAEQIDRWPDLADDLFTDKEWKTRTYDERVEYLLDIASAAAILQKAKQSDQTIGLIESLLMQAQNFQLRGEK